MGWRPMQRPRLNLREQVRGLMPTSQPKARYVNYIEKSNSTYSLYSCVLHISVVSIIVNVLDTYSSTRDTALC